MEVLRRTDLVKNLSDSALVFAEVLILAMPPYATPTPLLFGKGLRYGKFTDMPFPVLE